MSVENVDQRLGWLQREFGLTGSELRKIVTDRPKLATLPAKIIADMRFGLKEFLEFDDESIRTMMKSCSKLFTKDYASVQANFTFLTQVAKFTRADIAFYPAVLQVSYVLLKTRYAYLKHLDRLQFDPTKPNYVSLKMMVEHDDREFCQRVAKTSVDDFNKFLRTI
jgi:mTERF domain-containing protein